MFQPDSLQPPQKRRRAATAVLVLVTLPVMLGMAALAIDVGVMYNTRADLQRAADAAAMAGASAYTTDSMMQIRQGDDGSSLFSQVEYLADTRASGTSVLNPSFGTEVTNVAFSDIQVGWLDVTSGTSPLHVGVAPDDHNAVQVTVRRADEGGNGPVQLFFASLFGISETEISASATAVFDDRVGGFDIGESGGALLPFTIHEDVYENDIVSGGDDYGYDPDLGSVTSGADGVRETNLYPHDVAPGNFGLLNLPSDSPSDATAHKEQIDNGVQPEDIESDIGGTEFTFFDEDGNPITYTLGGNPGLEVTLKANLENRVGDVVAFLLHDAATEGGSNTEYHIVGIRFGRLMAHSLNKKPNGIWIQPTVYAGNGLRIDKSAPSSGGTMGRLVLGR